MAKQTFVTGQVLTAAQQNALQLNDYNQTVSAKVASYVLVAADAGTRITMSNAGATTITVNTSLFTAGDTLFITNIGAGACTITAGTATVSTASSLVLAQYDSGRLYFTSTGVAIWEKYQGASAGGGGKVLQVVTANYGTAVINSTGTYADTGLTATITPATTGSRILVMVTHADSYRTGSTSGLVLNIKRGATEIWNNGTSGDETNYATADTVVFTTSFSYLDSPATTSATTYKTQLKNSAAIASVRTNFNSTAGTSQIILIEIGA